MAITKHYSGSPESTYARMTAADNFENFTLVISENSFSLYNPFLIL